MQTIWISVSDPPLGCNPLLAFRRPPGPGARRRGPLHLRVAFKFVPLAGRAAELELRALEILKADPSLRKIPVVILTTSKAEEDILRSYDLGVNSYITKPVSFQGLAEVMRVLSIYWFEIVRLPNDCRER